MIECQMTQELAEHNARRGRRVLFESRHIISSQLDSVHVFKIALLKLYARVTRCIALVQKGELSIVKQREYADKEVE